MCNNYTHTNYSTCTNNYCPKICDFSQIHTSLLMVTRFGVGLLYVLNFFFIKSLPL